jgi:hypothetical protein
MPSGGGRGAFYRGHQVPCGPMNPWQLIIWTLDTNRPWTTAKMDSQRWWVLDSVLSGFLQVLSQIISFMSVCLFRVYDGGPGTCFLNKSSCIQIFTKTCGICQFKPLDLCWWSYLFTYTSYIDGLWWALSTINNYFVGENPTHKHFIMCNHDDGHDRY